MSQFSFIVSCIDASGQKHEETISLDSQDYKHHYEDNFAVLMHSYPPDQAEKHILATKKHYIEEAIAAQVGGHGEIEYDVAEMINTLDNEVKGIH